MSHAASAVWDFFHDPGITPWTVDQRDRVLIVSPLTNQVGFVRVKAVLVSQHFKIPNADRDDLSHGESPLSSKDLLI